MIKGQTTIILTDKNGNKEIHKDNNLVTNALQNFFANGGWMNPSPFASSNSNLISEDMVVRMLGGLLLLDTAQTESANTVMIEKGTKMIGNGSNGVASNDAVTELGSYNSEESGWNDAGTVFTQVWDFSTSQANGTIKSVCLTSKANGYIGEGNTTSNVRKSDAGNYSNFSDNMFSLTKTTNAKAIGYDNNYIYSVVNDTTSKTLTFVRTRCPQTSVDMRDILNVAKNEVLATYDYSSWISDARYYATVYNTYMDDNYLYIVLPMQRGSTYIFADDTPIRLVKVARTGYAITVDVFSPTSTGIASADGTKAVVTDGYLIVNNSTNFYKVNLSNVADVTQLTNAGSSTDFTVLQNHGGRVYTRDAVIDTEADAVYVRNCGMESNNYTKTGNPLLCLQSPTSNTTIKRWNGYLGTVNNLAKSITKDVTRTMKVIYTLTFS